MSGDTPETPPGGDDNVVTHARFVGGTKPPEGVAPLDLNQFRKAGLLTATDKKLEDLKLPEPRYNETVIGTLTDDEADLFVQFYEAQAERKKTEREVGGGFLVKIGQHVQTSQEDTPVDPNDMVSEEDAVRFFKAIRRHESLKAILFWQLSERLGHHDWLLAVRTKRRVVLFKRQW